MNANELADLIGLCGDGGYNQDAATMLRQQQAEIDTYKLQNNNQIDTYKYKNLTDKEITEVFDNTFKVRDFDDAFLKFAKAILRKAQEK
jgi:hypothetical protein